VIINKQVRCSSGPAIGCTKMSYMSDLCDWSPKLISRFLDRFFREHHLRGRIVGSGEIKKRAFVPLEIAT